MSCEHCRHSRNSALRTQVAGDELRGEEWLLGITEVLGPSPVVAVAPTGGDRRPPFHLPGAPLQRRRVCQVFPPDEPPPASSKGRAGG